MKTILTLIIFITSTLVHAGQDYPTTKEQLTSPVTTDAKWFLLGGTAALGLALAFEDGFIDTTQDNAQKNKPLGDLSKLGDDLGQLIPNALYVGSMAIYGASKDDKLAKHRAWMMTKATAYAGAVTWMIKPIVREPRPDDHKDRTSFPSGHSATFFTFAGYVAEEHGWQWGAPAALLGAFVGYSRINDNRHQVHDVIAGATIGWSIGWGMGRVTREVKPECNAAPMKDGAMITCPWD